MDYRQKSQKKVGVERGLRSLTRDGCKKQRCKTKDKRIGEYKRITAWGKDYGKNVRDNSTFVELSTTQLG
jgi:hypothetical protein